MIPVDPKTLHIIIFAHKHLFSIYSQTCDTDTIARCSFKLKLIIFGIDLVQTEAMLEFIETTEKGFQKLKPQKILSDTYLDQEGLTKRH